MQRTGWNAIKGPLMHQRGVMQKSEVDAKIERVVQFRRLIETHFVIDFD